MIRVKSKIGILFIILTNILFIILKINSLFLINIIQTIFITFYIEYSKNIKIRILDDAILVQYLFGKAKIYGFEITSIELNKNNNLKIPEILTSIKKDWNKNVKISFELSVINNKPSINYYIHIHGNQEIEITKELSKIYLLIYNQYKNAKIIKIRGKDLFRKLQLDSIFSKKISKKIFTYNRNKILSNFTLKGMPANSNISINELMKYILHLENSNIFFRITFWPINEKIAFYKIKKKYEKLKTRNVKNNEFYKYEKLYNEITKYSGWWGISVEITIQTSKTLEHHKEIISKTIHQVETIFSESNFIIKTQINNPKDSLLKYLKYGYVKKQNIGTIRLSSFLTLPTIQLPQIIDKSFPEFIIPNEKDVSGPIYIGDVIFERKSIFKVGIEPIYLTRHMAVFGQTGSGKSTFVKCLIDEIQRKTNIPFMILDYKGEYTSLITTSPKKIFYFQPASKENFMHINLFRTISGSDENHANRLFSIIKEILGISESSELSPAMEKLLLISIKNAIKNKAKIFSDLIAEINKNEEAIQATKDALISRLQPFIKPPLSSIFNSYEEQVDINDLMQKRVIIDLSQIRIQGTSKDVQLFVNLMTSFVFNAALKRGFFKDLKHLLVIEEAHFLVPEIYSRKTSAEMATSEDIVLLERASGEGVIVISSRPNISKNIIANTATKIAFRVPFDIDIIKKFMMLNDEAADFLKYAPIGHAIAVMPHVLHPFLIKTRSCQYPQYSKLNKYKTKISRNISTLILSEIEAKGYLLNSTLMKIVNNQKIENKYVLKTINKMLKENKIIKCYSPFVNSGFLYTKDKKICEKICKTILLKYLKTVFNRLSIEYIETPIEGIDILINGAAISIINNEYEIINNLIKYENAIKNIGESAEIHIIFAKDTLTAEAISKIIEKYSFFNQTLVIPAFPEIIDKIVKLIINDKFSQIWKLQKVII